MEGLRVLCPYYINNTQKMDKDSFRREVKRNIERELGIYGFRMSPDVERTIDWRIRNYLNSFDDARFYDPVFVDEMQQRKRAFVRILMSHSEKGAITRHSFMRTNAAYCKTYPCRDGNI